jgi:hypothetical protein
MRDPQNFFKHASTDPKDIKTYQPYIGTLILADACLLHQDLFGLTSFIRAFTIRLSFEKPDIFLPGELSEKITQRILTRDLGGVSRTVFFDLVLRRLANAAVRIS